MTRGGCSLQTRRESGSSQVVGVGEGRKGEEVSLTSLRHRESSGVDRMGLAPPSALRKTCRRRSWVLRNGVRNVVISWK